MENIGLGLTLMAVGMITVFVILLLIINLSKLLILIVNKVAPEEAQKPSKGTAAAAQTVDATTMSIITAAVAQITDGKGTVAKVERI